SPGPSSLPLNLGALLAALRVATETERPRLRRLAHLPADQAPRLGRRPRARQKAQLAVFVGEGARERPVERREPRAQADCRSVRAKSSPTKSNGASCSWASA